MKTYFLRFVFVVLVGCLLAPSYFFTGCAATKVVRYGGEGSGIGPKVYIPRGGGDFSQSRSWLTGRRIFIEVQGRWSGGDERTLLAKTAHLLSKRGVIIINKIDNTCHKVIVVTENAGGNKHIYLKYSLPPYNEEVFSVVGTGFDLSEGRYWSYSGSMSNREWENTSWGYALRAAVETLAALPVQMN